MRSRRSFLAQSLAVASAPALLGQSRKPSFRVGVIGHTGRGNYGHGLDVVWNLLKETNIVAVADANAGGLAKAKSKLKTDHAYADYREMLRKEKPDVVAVCPRHVDQRVPMITAACEAGAKGIYVEKPFVRSPEEGDRIAEACAKAGTKLAVAHRNRYHPVLPVLKKLLAEGLIGDVLELRGRGKEDRRGGGEDLWVLGAHVMDMIRAIGGAPRSCYATVSWQGHPVRKKDVFDGPEGLGPLAGDAVHAMYGMENGVTGYFSSVRNQAGNPRRYGLQIFGSRGVIELIEGTLPSVQFLGDASWSPGRSGAKWQSVSSAGIGKPEPLKGPRFSARHTLGILDLIEAIEKGREPKCGMHEAAGVVEMIAACFESHRVGEPVALPLQTRVNPLTRF